MSVRAEAEVDKKVAQAAHARAWPAAAWRQRWRRLAPRAPKADAPHGHRRAPRRHPRPHPQWHLPSADKAGTLGGGAGGGPEEEKKKEEAAAMAACCEVPPHTDPFGSVQHCPNGSPQVSPSTLMSAPLSFPDHLAGRRLHTAQQARASTYLPLPSIRDRCTTRLQALRSYSQPLSLRLRLRPPTALHRPLRMSCRPRGSGPGLNSSLRCCRMSRLM